MNLNPDLVRVRDRISEAILDFLADAQRYGGGFRAEDLRSHVARVCPGTAPGSADRIMRDLRKRGRINYVCVSRAQSLYEIRDIRPGANSPLAEPGRPKSARPPSVAPPPRGADAGAARALSSPGEEQLDFADLMERTG